MSETTMQEPDDLRAAANPKLTDAQIAEFEPLVTVRHLSDGEALFQAGDRRGGFFIGAVPRTEWLPPEIGTDV